ncbi:MAG: hypothetical protein RML45_04275 [Acetobacteraceae bacterium]|nr:hypothetical protein [Acetobacteraceae bacterium]
MRGEIECASEPEKGGIVAVSLGVAPQPAGAAVEDGRTGRRPSPAEPPGAVNALLVDGNGIGREAVAALLRRVGATVETPADGREGVSKATCATFDPTS